MYHTSKRKLALDEIRKRALAEHTDISVEDDCYTFYVTHSDSPAFTAGKAKELHRYLKQLNYYIVTSVAPM